PFQAATLQLNLKGESIEACAREARYAYLASLLQKDEILCTAHHQDDQCETVLLQLMRGAGPKGLAAMPLLQSFAAGYHARPLLTLNREIILKYAQTHQLNWINDDSNADVKFDRNFLRHDIVPLLKKRWPQASQTISRSATHCASHQGLLEDYLHKELTTLTGHFPDTLSRRQLMQYPRDKQSYLLRTWLVQKKIPLPSTMQLTHILKLLYAREEAQTTVTWQNYQARFYRDDLFIEHHDFFKAQPALNLTWEGNTPLYLPMGYLTLEANALGPISKHKLPPTLNVKFRENNQKLKKIFQELGIPPWQRWQLPLIYADGKLVAIADRWVAPAFRAMRGEPGLRFSLNKECK
ncbi:MAG TPA: tRNA lysidine(34) synthetase TilS, partial [Gammaproteobacteria bacterium]|nr:tRNA lysidine(34) synthetase TilS [Gammaproteobacteria bacterium]